MGMGFIALRGKGAKEIADQMLADAPSFEKIECHDRLVCVRVDCGYEVGKLCAGCGAQVEWHLHPDGEHAWDDKYRFDVHGFYPERAKTQS